jgi:hypothetical protein
MKSLPIQLDPSITCDVFGNLIRKDRKLTSEVKTSGVKLLELKLEQIHYVLKKPALVCPLLFRRMFGPNYVDRIKNLHIFLFRSLLL